MIAMKAWEEKTAAKKEEKTAAKKKARGPRPGGKSNDCNEGLGGKSFYSSKEEGPGGKEATKS